MKTIFNTILSLFVPFLIAMATTGFAVVHGALGNIRGKAGGWTFSVLKGQQIMKEKSIPFNPQSTKQTAIRTVFRKIISEFKPVAQDWVQTLWNPFATGKETGWGNLISKNLLAMGDTWDASKLVPTYGSIDPPLDLAATYDTATGNVVVTWDDTEFGNRESDNKDNNLKTLEDDEDVQFDDIGNTDFGDGTATYSIPTGYTATNVRVWQSFRSLDPVTGEVTGVSNSATCVCTAPA